ncbi:hypothetical protein [Leptolyngbya ohadii]|uniref:hypothetical protein n=1 Tax=Leptolyngbya ohadii TaxID=1962290 RepID=UPI000B59DCAE|nr:hypothetical protein [Leptolyngbya ohadii]
MCQSTCLSFDRYYEQACEYVVPIKVHVPIFLEPHVLVKPTHCVREKVEVYLEPEIYLQPEVQAAPPVCIPQDDFHALPIHED